MGIDKYKEDLADLIKRGDDLFWAMYNAENPSDFKKQLTEQFGDEEAAKVVKGLPVFADKYQGWYSEALTLIEQIMPQRVDDFKDYYKPIRPRKALEYGTYTVSDYLEGTRVTRGWEKEEVVGTRAAIPKFKQQLQLVKGLEKRFESSLFDIRTLVQAEVLDSEIEAAEELLKNGYNRAAGAICGVVLEDHFGEVCIRHSIKIGKKDPTIADYNDALKNADIVDMPTWRSIQYLTDLRNLCDHKKTTEPTKEQAKELIDGTRKTIKTVL